jgi:hypothetical protein
LKLSFDELKSKLMRTLITQSAHSRPYFRFIRIPFQQNVFHSFLHEPLPIRVRQDVELFVTNRVENLARNLRRS